MRNEAISEAEVSPPTILGVSAIVRGLQSILILIISLTVMNNENRCIGLLADNALSHGP